jgi:hypothetical protein
MPKSTTANPLQSELAHRGGQTRRPRAREARGVQGSPEFFLDERGYICSALRIDNIDAKPEITPNHRTFDACLSDCFR